MGSNVNLHRHLLILCAVSSVGVGRVGAQQTVALVLAQRNSGFHQAIACGARAAAMELGVTINVQAAAVYSAVDQIPLLNSVMATAPAAIVIDPAHATSLLAPLREAARSGAKIVAVDTSIDDPSILSAVIATDNVEVGREAAEALASLIGDRRGKVAMINSIPGISTVDDRIRGFEEAIEDHPNLLYIGNQFAGENVPAAQSAFISLMSANPDLVGVAALSNNPAIGVAGGIRVTGVSERVVAVAVDADEVEIAALRAGGLDALIIQRPYEMGYQGVIQAVAAVRAEPVRTPIRTETITATRENLDQPNVQRYLYRGDCI